MMNAPLIRSQPLFGQMTQPDEQLPNKSEQNVTARRPTARKKPGLKRGAKIKSVAKLKGYRVAEIVGMIEIRSREMPMNPYSYTELAALAEYSTVTLRNRSEIRIAMEEAIARKSAIAEVTVEKADPASLILSLRQQIKEQEKELTWHRKYFQEHYISLLENNASTKTTESNDSGDKKNESNHIRRSSPLPISRR